LTEVFIL